jgi:hypothetical protein
MTRMNTVGTLARSINVAGDEVTSFKLRPSTKAAVNTHALWNANGVTPALILAFSTGEKEWRCAARVTWTRAVRMPLIVIRMKPANDSPSPPRRGRIVVRLSAFCAFFCGSIVFSGEIRGAGGGAGAGLLITNRKERKGRRGELVSCIPRFAFFAVGEWNFLNLHAPGV